MLRSPKYPILLCVLLLLKSSASLKHTSDRGKFSSSVEGTEMLSRQQADNLRAILNFIRDSPEFHPLTFSMIIPEFQSSFADFLLMYIRRNSIEAYTVRAEDLSPKATWADRVGLTWIFVVRDLSTLNIFIHRHGEIWKSGNQYLLIFTNEEIVPTWRNIFKNLWEKYSVYRCIFVSVQDDFGCLTKYMPFDKFNDDFGRVRKLCLKKNSLVSSQDEIVQLNEGAKLFENFRNLNNYPVKVIVFESLLMNVSYDEKHRLKLGKLDANVMFTLEKAMGARFILRAMKKIEFNGDPFASSLRSIEKGDAEMVITGFFVKVYGNFQKFQFTCAAYEDKLCFLSPDSGLLPKAYMPFLPFQKNLWALLMLYNVLITLLWCLVKRINESLRKPADFHVKRVDTALNGLAPIVRSSGNETIRQFNHSRGYSRKLGLARELNLPNQRAPPEFPGYATKFFGFLEDLCYPLQRGETPTQKALLVGALFFGLIVNNLYQSYLVSSLSKPFHYPQLHTLEDVLESKKLVITKYVNLKNVFLDDSPLDMKLSERIRVISTRRSTKDFVAYENKISITRYYTTVLGDIAYYDKDGNPLIYLVDECPMNYRVSYVLRFRSPYTERVDFVLLRAREAGLLGFWFEEMVYPIRLAGIRRQLDNEKRRIKLTLAHYSLTFSLLFLGLFGAALMFLFEVYVVRRDTRRR